jgi:uncharacterized membrane protein YwaF
MGEYFARDYTGAPFELYGVGHNIALALIIVACFSLIYFRTAWGEREKKFVRYFLGAFLIVDELSWHAWAVYWDIWNINFMLPLHLCSLMV